MSYMTRLHYLTAPPPPYQPDSYSIPRSHGPILASGPLHHSSPVWLSFQSLVPTAVYPGGPDRPRHKIAHPSLFHLHAFFTCLMFPLNSYQHLSPHICAYFMIYSVRGGASHITVIFSVWHIVGTQVCVNCPVNPRGDREGNRS